jgi:hypothetical protein
VVKENIPALAHLAGLIGDPAVRHRGTIGGSIANNDPNADYPAACLGLGATIITNKRRIAADEFFHGLFTTALEDDEIITKIQFLPNKAAYVKVPTRPHATRWSGSSYRRSPNPRGGDRRRLERRVPGDRVREARRALWREVAGRPDRAGRRHGQRHPRQC